MSYFDEQSVSSTGSGHHHGEETELWHVTMWQSYDMWDRVMTNIQEVHTDNEWQVWVSVFKEQNADVFEFDVCFKLMTTASAVILNVLCDTDTED